MTENLNKNQQVQPQKLSSTTHANADNTVKLFQGDIKTHRPSKIYFKGDDTKQMIRSAKSGSVKTKLNLQNTKLRINVQNLSTVITVHQQNEAKFKVELDRYKQKIAKYKQKIKQKDSIIVKLLQKLERRVQLDGKTLQNIVLKLHDQQIKSYKNKIEKGADVNIQQIIRSYQQLLKGFNQQEKDRIYLQNQKQELQKTVKQLKETIKYIGEGKSFKPNEQMSIIKSKLLQTQTMLQNQKLARGQLLKSLAANNLQVAPQIKSILRDIERDRIAIQAKPEYKNIDNKDLSEQINNLKQKLAKSQLDLFQQQQNRKGNEKKYLAIQQNVSNLNRSFSKSNQFLQKLQQKIRQIQTKYLKQMGQLQQKINSLVTQQNQLQSHKAKVQQISKQFNKFIQMFNTQSKRWSQLQSQYIHKLSQADQRKRVVQDKLEREKQKRRIFELKLINDDQQRGIQGIQQNKPQQKQVYLEKRFDILKSQSLTSKKQADNLNQQLQKSKMAYNILQNQLNYTQQKLYKLSQLLKKQNISPQQISQISSKTTPIKKQQGDKQSSQNIINSINIDTQNLSKEQLRQKIIQAHLHNNFLQNQLNELRAQNINIRINYESAKKQMDIKQNQNSELMQKIKRKSSVSSNKKGLIGSGKILQKGQTYVQSSDVEGGYEVNVINVNDIPAQIQQMSFEQLAGKYQAVCDQLLYVKQKLKQIQKSTNKITQFQLKDNNIQNNNQNQPSQSQRQRQKQKQKQKQNRKQKQTILDQQNQPYQQQVNSQDIDEDVYKNINQEMDRLINKNIILQKQIQQHKRQNSTRILMYENLIKQLKQKLKSGEQINQNLSNIVVHLQQQLSKYQNNLDLSGVGQKGSQIVQGSSKKSRESQFTNNQFISNLNKQIILKKKQYQQLLINAQKQQKNNKAQGQQRSQKQLQKLQQQIKNLQQKLQYQTQSERNIVSKANQKDNIVSSLPLQQQCANCQALTKVNADLARKLNKYQQTKQNKNNALKQQLQSINLQYKPNNGSTTDNFVQLIKQNKKLKNLLAQLKVQVNFDKMQQENKQQQLKNLKQINQQLLSSIHEKQKMLLKLKTQNYKQNYDGQGQGQDDRKKVDSIFQSYVQKIQQLQNLLKGQQKTQINITDLYDTINYLNNQCQSVKKQLQVVTKQLQKKQQKQIIHIPIQIPIQIPVQREQLQQKYKQLKTCLQQLQKTAQQNNYKNINEMISNSIQTKQQNINLMRENNKLQNKIYQNNVQIQQYFNKINEGKAYQIIQAKDKQIESIQKNNEKLKQQIDKLMKQRDKIYSQNQKISKDLKNIESQVKRMTGDQTLQTTINDDRKQLQNTNIGQLQIKTSQIAAGVEAQKQSQHNYIIQNIRRKLQILKSAIQNSSYKNRPNFDIQSFKQLPILQDTIIILLDRLHFVWNLVQQRTNQYNQLRDQMNIISMQCMKGTQLQAENQKSLDKQSREKQKNQQIFQQKYQQVLAELIEYENQNKRLERQVNRLKQQITVYKKQIQQIQTKYISQLKSQSSQQAPYNHQLLNKFLQSQPYSVTTPVQKQLPQIIKLFLARIKQLQGNLQNIQVEFDQKNQKLQSLILKQKSFISQKSRLKNSDESVNSNPRKQIATDREMIDSVKQPQQIGASLVISNSLGSPAQMMQQKSYSLNSVKVFKQIQQLTKANQQLRDKKHKYRNLLQNISKTVQVVIKKAQNSLQTQLKKELQNYIDIINKEGQQDSKRDNSGFDLEGGDLILSSSFAQKNKKIQNHQLDQVNKTLQIQKQQLGQGAKKMQEDNTKRYEKNVKFLEQNKFLLQQLIDKINQQIKPQKNAQQIKRKIALKFSDQQIQQLLYLTDADKAVIKILSILAQPQKSKLKSSQKLQKSKKMQQIQISSQIQNSPRYQQVQQGEWVQTEQLQAIINQIYPTKSQLCIIIANSINMLMLAQTKQGILKAVQFLFTNLKRKQNQTKQQFKRRDQSVTQYGKKLQKLLLNKYSQQDSQKSSLVNQNSFRKTVDFKSQYQIKKEQEGDNSVSHSNSQSYSGNSGFLEKSLK